RTSTTARTNSAICKRVADGRAGLCLARQPATRLQTEGSAGQRPAGSVEMSVAVAWRVAGLYFEACNCASVCPCYSARPPTYGYCEGPGVWHITEGRFGEVSLDGLNVV